MDDCATTSIVFVDTSTSTQEYVHLQSTAIVWFGAVGLTLATAVFVIWIFQHFRK